MRLLTLGLLLWTLGALGHTWSRWVARGVTDWGLPTLAAVIGGSVVTGLGAHQLGAADWTVGCMQAPALLAGLILAVKVTDFARMRLKRMRPGLPPLPVYDPPQTREQREAVAAQIGVGTYIPPQTREQVDNLTAQLRVDEPLPAIPADRLLALERKVHELEARERVEQGKGPARMFGGG